MLQVSILKRVKMATNFPRLLLYDFKSFFKRPNLSRAISCPPVPVAARWVRIRQGPWIFVLCECCVLSSRSLCDELITRTEETYRLWCVVVYDPETSRMCKPWPALGCCATVRDGRNYLTSSMQVGVGPVEVTYLSLYFPFLSLFTTITKLYLQYNEELTTAPTEPVKNNSTQEANFHSVGKANPVPAWIEPEGSVS